MTPILYRLLFRYRNRELRSAKRGTVNWRETVARLPSPCAPFICLLVVYLAEAGALQVPVRVLEHGERFRHERRTADLLGLFHATGDERLLRAAPAVRFGGGGARQVSDVLEHAERSDRHRSRAVERHVMEEAVLACRAHIFGRECIVQLVARRRDLAGADLTNRKLGVELHRRAAVAAERRVAGPALARESSLVEPAAHRVHVGARAEPHEESIDAFRREQLDQAIETVRLQSWLLAAQVHAVAVERGRRALPVAIDRDVALAERRAVELPLHEAGGLALRVEPARQALHLQGQAGTTHRRDGRRSIRSCPSPPGRSCPRSP